MGHSYPTSGVPTLVGFFFTSHGTSVGRSRCPSDVPSVPRTSQASHGRPTRPTGVPWDVPCVRTLGRPTRPSLGRPTSVRWDVQACPLDIHWTSIGRPMAVPWDTGVQFARVRNGTYQDTHETTLEILPLNTLHSFLPSQEQIHVRIAWPI